MIKYRIDITFQISNHMFEFVIKQFLFNEFQAQFNSSVDAPL